MVRPPAGSAAGQGAAPGATVAAPPGAASDPRGSRRIGLFGGAFDPPHLAHAALAAAAIDQLQLDELRILPTGQAWHKSRGLTDAAHRVAMTRLAFAGLPVVVVDEREIRRQGPSYTVDTLREVAAEAPGAALFLVIGADQALAFDRWRAPDEIAALATICVAGRPAEGQRAPEGTQESMGLHGQSRPDEAAAASPRYPIAGGRWQDLRLPPMAVSATGIRQALARGETPAGLLDAAVARYIAHHHLYSLHR